MKMLFIWHYWVTTVSFYVNIINIQVINKKVRSGENITIIKYYNPLLQVVKVFIKSNYNKKWS